MTLIKNRIAWNKGKPWDEETKKKISKSCKGKPPWNKGLKGYGKEWLVPRFVKGQTAWNKGIPWSEEVKQKISESKKRNHVTANV